MKGNTTIILEIMMSTIKQQKLLLRKELNAVLKSLNRDDIIKQSNFVVERLLIDPKYIEAKSVSIYISFDQEIQTDALIKNIFQSGKMCYIPRFQKGIAEMEMIKLESLSDYESLPLNAWNIRQPKDDEVRESVFNSNQLDLIIAPGLGFTQDGFRLGRGKAYYDRFFTKCKNHFEKEPFKIGLAFKQQIVENIPYDSTDVKLDKVIYSIE